MEAVEISVAVDASVVMVRHQRVVGPWFVRAIRPQLDQQSAGVVTGGEKRLVTDDERRGGVDRCIDAGPPLHIETQPSRRWIEEHHAAAREEYGMRDAVDPGERGRGIA